MAKVKRHREAMDVVSYAAQRYAEGHRALGEATEQATASLKGLGDVLRRPTDVAGLKALVKRGDEEAAKELHRRGIYWKAA